MHYLPTTLLAKSLRVAVDHDGGGFGVIFAHFVAAVVVLRDAKISFTAFGLAQRDMLHARAREAVHGVKPFPEPGRERVVGAVLGREVCPPAQIEPDPRAVEVVAPVHSYVGPARARSGRPTPDASIVVQTPFEYILNSALLLDASQP